MKVKVLRDATLTVTAGQIVDIKDAAPALKLGMVVPAEEEEKPAKKPASKKK